MTKQDQLIASRGHEITRLRDENQLLRAENQVHRDKSRGDYWVWQGDGSDHLESLVCPVLIQPKQLQQLLANVDNYPAPMGDHILKSTS